MSSRIPFVKSFSFLLLLGYGITTLLTASIFTVLVYANQVDLIADNALYASLLHGETIVRALEARRKPDGKVDLAAWSKAVLDEGQTEQDVRVIDLSVFGDQGELVFSTVDRPVGINEFQEVQTAITKRDFESRFFHHRIDIRSRTVSLYIPYPAENEETRVIRAGLFISRIDQRMENLRRQVALLVSAVMLINSLLLLYVHRMAVRPFHLLIRQLDNLARSDFEASAPRFRSMEFELVSREIQRMSFAVRDMQDTARSANPLTGLPGNVQIERNIVQRIQSNDTFCFLYADLDNFKAYNDAYGFKKGDDVILFTRDILARAVEEAGSRDVFIGHEGGDDFVLICRYEDWEALARRCVQFFDQGIGGFYSQEDRDRGYIVSVDRRGQETSFPLVSISIAAVSNARRTFSNVGEVVQVAAEMKKYVKGIDGSAYAMDQRNDLRRGL